MKKLEKMNEKKTKKLSKNEMNKVFGGAAKCSRSAVYCQTGDSQCPIVFDYWVTDPCSGSGGA